MASAASSASVRCSGGRKYCSRRSVYSSSPVNSSRCERIGTPERRELGAVRVEAPREGLVGHVVVALDVLLDVARGGCAPLGHQIGDERELADELVGIRSHGWPAYRPREPGGRVANLRSVRVLTGIAFVVAVLVGSARFRAASARGRRCPPATPRWWSPDASLRLAPLRRCSGRRTPSSTPALTGWTLQGPGTRRRARGWPGAALRGDPRQHDAGLDALDAAAIGTDRHGLGTRAAPARDAARRRAGRRAARSCSARSRRGSRGGAIALARDADPRAADLARARPGDAVRRRHRRRRSRSHRVARARVRVRRRRATTRLAGGPDGAALAAEPGDFLLRGAPFRVPRDAATLSLWMRARAGSAPQVSIEVERARRSDVRRRARAGRRCGSTRARCAGRSVRLRVRSGDATGLQLALIGTVQRAPALRVAKTRRDPEGSPRRCTSWSGPGGLASQPVRIEIERAGVVPRRDRRAARRDRTGGARRCRRRSSAPRSACCTPAARRSRRASRRCARRLRAPAKP